MDIRLATTAEIPGLLALLAQVGQVHHEIRPDIFPAGTLKYDATALEVLLTDVGRPVFVFMEGDFVAGYCFCVLKRIEAGTCAVARSELYIDDLCVDAGHRRRGIADKLYRHAVDYARQIGCDSVTLNVWCGNDSAMDFYLHHGMKPRNIMMETKLC
jgi:ribosomal protein S18 acetylase RimI-like enzyme